MKKGYSVLSVITATSLFRQMRRAFLLLLVAATSAANANASEQLKGRIRLGTMEPIANAEIPKIYSKPEAFIGTQLRSFLEGGGYINNSALDPIRLDVQILRFDWDNLLGTFSSTIAVRYTLTSATSEITEVISSNATATLTDYLSGPERNNHLMRLLATDNLNKFRDHFQTVSFPDAQPKLSATFRQGALPPCDPNVTSSTSWTNCQGTANIANGDKYVGEFRDNKYHGQGTYYFLANNQFKGDEYVGEFRDGRIIGQGTYYHSANNQFKGDEYVGEFRDGKRHGQGIYTFADGKPPQEGIWEDHKFVRKQRIPDHIAGRSPATNSEPQITPDKASSSDVSQTAPRVPIPGLEAIKAKCAELGFKAGTEKFGDCVLKLSK
jgi:hypothetical protein